MASLFVSLRERLASYKVPSRVLFFDEDEISMNGSGTKVQHDQLPEVVQERLHSMESRR